MCIFFLSYLDHTHLRTYSFIRSRSEQSSSLVIVIQIKVDDTCIGEAEVDLDELVDGNKEGNATLYIFDLKLD